jgi:predicted fused transcriptional regulator/phosphomethylpyrimidine kinase
MMLADAARLATMSHDTLTLVAAELGVPIGSASRQLPVPATRALIRAAVEVGWNDGLVERLRLHGLAALSVDPDVDLATLEAWRTLAADI